MVFRSLLLAVVWIAACLRRGAGGGAASAGVLGRQGTAAEARPHGLERLRFLTTTDFPPFNFLDGNGRLSGFHVDLARAICAELGIVDKCQIQALPWDELDAALQKGEGEAIMAGIAVTARDARQIRLLAALSAVSRRAS